jgi:hypothetical protein
MFDADTAIQVETVVVVQAGTVVVVAVLFFQQKWLARQQNWES